MFKRFGVLVAIIGFAMSACPASAITLPINENAGASAVTTLQQTVADIAKGAAQIVTSIETSIGRIVGEVADRLADVEQSGKTFSNTAAAGGAGDEPTTPASPVSVPLPPSATTTEIIVEKEQPVIEAVPTDGTVTQGELADLLSGLKSALSLIAAQKNATPSNVESQIAALQSAISSQGYRAVASPPQYVAANGNPLAYGAGTRIDQLSGTAITSPSITGGSIAGASLSGSSVSANSLSVSGDTSLSGDLNVGGNFSAGSISFGAASSSNSITTNATSTNLFATFANFGSMIANTITASVANIVGLTAVNATTTNLVTTNATMRADN